MKTLKNTALIVNHFVERVCELRADRFRTDSRAAANSSYKKLAVQWLHSALCFVSSSVVSDSFHLRNRQLLLAAKRCGHCDNPVQK